jgi:ABC-2 type transport system ATP-binding protein
MRVEARSLRKAFGKAVALRGVDLDVASGRRVALIGPNGSGKSTLIRALLGLVACEGDVRIDGLSPWRDRLATARRTAYVPQVAPHLAAPVGELVRATCSVRDLPPLEVERVADRLSLDLGALRKQPFRNLSGGMKQKLLLSLGLAARAGLLVLDEPTASLDAEARDRFFDLCGEISPATTILLCSHRLEEIEHLVDDVVALHEGRVRHAGSAEDWLRVRSRSLVEVKLKDRSREPALGRLGFAEGRSGWWWRSAGRAEAVALASTIALQVGEAVEDIVVRHVERVDSDVLPEVSVA